AQEVVVDPDDAGVGGRALAEVDLPVGADRHLVVVVVAEARQPGDQVADLHRPLDHRNLAAVGDVELALVPQDVVDRAGELVGHDLGRGRARLAGRGDADYAGRGGLVAGRLAGLGDVHG